MPRFSRHFTVPPFPRPLFFVESWSSLLSLSLSSPSYVILNIRLYLSIIHWIQQNKNLEGLFTASHVYFGSVWSSVALFCVISTQNTFLISEIFASRLRCILHIGAVFFVRPFQSFWYLFESILVASCYSFRFESREKSDRMWERGKNDGTVSQLTICCLSFTLMHSKRTK